MNTRPSRRRFLGSLGLGALGFGAGLGAFELGPRGFHAGRAVARANEAPSSLRGSKTGRPLRFVGVYMPHGHAYEYFAPRVDPVSGSRFDLGFEHSILAPFEDETTFGKKYKEQLIVVDGVDLTAGIEVGTVGHDAPRVILTGSGANGKNASIDQYLAVECGLGDDTIHTSLTLAVGNDDSGIGSNVSYAAGGTPVPKLIDPRAVFSELFGRPLTGKEQSRLDAERALGRSVLDFVSSDLASVKKRVAASERLKLEQHEAALRDIEKRLVRVAPACDAPTEPSEYERLRSYGGGEAHFDAITDSMIDQLARAFACDLTRFATLFLSDLSRTRHAPGMPDDVHAEVAHVYRSRTGTHPGQPDSWLPLAQQNRYVMTKLARLAQRLDEAGVLEDTIVYATSDMGDPARHSSRHVPTLLLGGAGGAFRTGRYLSLDPERGIPHNRILVSICQAFGIETDRFGSSPSSATITGRLERLHG